MLKKDEAAARAKAQEEADEMAGFQAFPSTQFSDHLRGCRFAFNSEIRRVGWRKAIFFALKGEMPIRIVRCSLISRCESVLYPARNTIDGGEQSGLPVIGPEQGDPGEVIDTSGEQRRLEQRTFWTAAIAARQEPDFWIIALQCRSRGSTSILECHGKATPRIARRI